MYSISVRNADMTTFTMVSSAMIRAELNPAVAEEARYIACIDAIEGLGIRYSNEDFDVLSGARAAIWRRNECERMGLAVDCSPGEFWHAKAA